MSIDLSTLNDVELNELFKSIKQEKELRSNPLRYKSGITNLVTKNESTFLKYIAELNKCMGDDIPEEKLSHYYENYRELEKSCLKICDITLGNYKVRINSLGSIKRGCNGSMIEIEDPTEYAEMYQELFKVIDKHLFKDAKD